MEREKLLDLLYEARTFFDRVEDLRNQHNRLSQEYRQIIPYERPREYIECRPYSIPQGSPKERKKWKGVSGFFKTIGIGLVLFLIIFVLIGELLMKYPSFYVLEASWVEWVSELFYHKRASELEDFYYIKIELCTIIMISILTAISARIMINLAIDRKNGQVRKWRDNIMAREQAIQQQNQDIDSYNASLVQKNKEIEEQNVCVMEHNRNVTRELEEVKGQLILLRNEMEDFIARDQFPREDFYPEAINFYINEVENHRCDSIKECANAYVAEKKNQRDQEFQEAVRSGMDEQIQIEREQLEMRKQQIQLQKVSIFLQAEQLISTIQNTCAVNQNTNAVNYNSNMNRENTAANNRNARASNRAADAANDLNSKLHKMGY